MANWKDYMNMAGSGAGKLALKLKNKNMHAARMNRLRTVIRCQERAAVREYQALGRYYYNALRSKENEIAEEHCKKLDQIQAQLDSALEALEEAVRDKAEAASIGVISGEDSTIFHFGGGPFEITVTRDVVYHPEDENSEEIDLDDVESFDHDPIPESAPIESAPAVPVAPVPAAPIEAEPNTAAAPELSTAAELDENDGLPFEG